MSFQIEQGLFKFEFIDHHAILGVPIDADPEQIRQRYKQIARRLHPDSCQAESQAEKDWAVQLFSKLVSPAYAQLSKVRNRAEHMVMLRRISKRLAGEAPQIQQLKSEAAKQLAQTGGNLDNVYKTLLQNLAANEYESLDKTLDAIAQISELNMVYLIRKDKEGQGFRTPLTTGNNVAFGGNPAGGSKDLNNKVVPQPKASPVDPYLRRAEEYIAKNNFAKAVLELRDALHLEPNNSSSHSLLGMAYLKQNQATMAKVHINKALQLNPKDPKALQAKQTLDAIAQKAAGSKTKTPQQSAQDKSTGGKPSDKSGGGLFGGLFGGKKK